MDTDTEIQAMGDISKALGDLTPEARARVLVWAADRFEVPIGSRAGARASFNSANNSPISDAPATRVYEDFATLFDAANPATAHHKAMVGAYWFQVVAGQATVDGQQVNAALKDLGHGVGNITDAFTTLMNQQPRLALQVQKSGKSRQARKKYKLTVEGIRAVERMATGSSVESESE